jgi:drug/metabolite transporter (DMT)-like permease
MDSPVMSIPEQRKLEPRFWLVICTISLSLGSCFAANRVALHEFGVYTIVAARAFGAACLLWAWIFVRKVSVPRVPRTWLYLSVVGVISIAIPQALIIYGQQYVASGLAGILNVTVSILTVGIAALVLPDERISLRKAMGVLVGMLGVIITIGIANLGRFDLNSRGQIAILAGCACFAASTVYVRRNAKPTMPLVATAIYFSATSLAMLPLAILRDGAPASVSSSSVAAIAYLSLASVTAYVLLYSFLARVGAANINLSNLLNAPVAVVLGALLFGEVLPDHAYLGFAVLAAGLLLIDGRVLLFTQRAIASRP